MSPRARRILIPIVVGGLALGVVLVSFVGGPPTKTTADDTTDVTADDVSATDPTADTEDAGTTPPAATPPVATPPASEGGETAADAPSFEGLRAVAPAGSTTGHATPPASIGSLDPEESPALFELTRRGAGISRITFSDIWVTADARLRARAERAAIARGETPAELVPDELRYVLTETKLLRNTYRGDGFEVPVLAASQLIVNGTSVNLFDYTTGDDGQPVYVWGETGPATFETTVVDGAGTPLIHITRRFVIAGFDLVLEQRLRNLSASPLEIRWRQFGPSSLPLDRSRYMDRRRFRFGYLPDPSNRALVLAEDNDLLFERSDVLKRWRKAEGAFEAGEAAERQDFLSLWPNKVSRDKEYGLSWFATTNRYFALAIHPDLSAQASGDRSLAARVEHITLEVSNPDPAEEGNEHFVVFTSLTSPARTIDPGTELNLDLGVYAGPLDRSILEQEEPFVSLSMQNLILYQMSSFCAICTFQWLAHGLLAFLTLLKAVVGDWGLAIIGLVVVVRLLLHPITKKSQISMQRFGKQMSAMKPELDKLQKKISDPKKLQQEQMRLMREHGLNPLQMLGCLPLFLQTPIWIALYAMLYFTFDLRQEPAFFGLFQRLTGDAWPFLADLSAADHFFGEVDEPFKFFMWNITGINLLPALMGVIFFIQQKYMSPPPSPTMTEDQLRQQKIMKVMMVVLFPLMLYSAPSGLTLYILTSSTIGILESRYIRAHVSEMDLNPPKKDKPRGRSKPKDAQGRAFAAAQARMEEKRRQKKRGPQKTYKKKKKKG
jgi:YidC/Oxa1 family membrane protein insertase